MNPIPITPADISVMRGLDNEALVNFLTERNLVTMGALSEKDDDEHIEPLGSTALHAIHEESNNLYYLTKAAKTEILALLKERIRDEKFVLQFELTPTVALLQTCLQELPDSSIIAYESPFEHIPAVVEGKPHPLLVDGGVDATGEDGLPVIFSGVSPDLAGAGDMLLQRAKKTRKRVTKLESSVLSDLRSKLLNGENLNSKDMIVITKMITPYRSFIKELFHASEIAKLGKIIKTNRHTKALTNANKTLLLSVLLKIERWYDQTTEVYAKGEQIDRTSDHVELSLRKVPGIDGNVLDGLLVPLQRGSKARSELVEGIRDKKELFLLLINIIRDKWDGPKKQEMLILLDKCISVNEKSLNEVISAWTNIDRSSKEFIDFLAAYKFPMKELDVMWEFFADIELRKEGFDTFVTGDPENVAHLVQEILNNKNNLSEDVVTFFKALQSEVAPQKLLFLHFKKRIYPHDVVQSINSIRTMIQENSRINLPSGVVALTGSATSPITPSPLEVDEQPISLGTQHDAGSYQERIEMPRFEGILKSYIETSKLLTKDAEIELSLFTKLVSTRGEVTLSKNELNYLQSKMEIIYRKQSVLKGNGGVSTMNFQGLADFVSSSRIQDVYNENLQRDFLQLCLAANGLLDRLFHSYNRGKHHVGSKELIESEEKSTLMVSEGVVSTSFLMRVLYDIMLIYNQYLIQFMKPQKIEDEHKFEEAQKLTKINKQKALDEMKAVLRDYYKSLAKMNGNVFKTNEEDFEEIQTQQEKKFTELLQGHTFMYEHLAGVLAEVQKLTKELGSKETMLQEVEAKYGKESIQYIIAHLSRMISLVGIAKGSNSQDVFVHLLGSDTPFVLLALLYQDVHTDEDSKEGYILGMLDTWYEKIDNTDAFFNQLDLISTLLPEGVLEDLYKMFAVYLLEREDISISTEKFDDENIFEAAYLGESGGEYDSGHYLTDELDYEGEVIYSSYDDQSSDHDRIYAAYENDPYAFFQDIILPSVEGNDFGCQVFAWLFENQQGKRLLESILAKNDSTYKPEYQDTLLDLKVKLTFGLSTILGTKLNTSSIATTLRGSTQEGYAGPGLAAGKVEEATADDVAALEELFRNKNMADLVAEEFAEEDGGED